MAKINTFEPYRDEKEIAAVTRVINSGWWKEGPECEKLEEEFCKYTGAKYAISVNSATSALDLILKAYGIKDGEIIVPALTFLSTGLIGPWNNCKVVFADVEPIHLTIDVHDVYKKITPDTKAIVVQHMSGHPVELDAFDQFKKYGILIVEDAAHGCGAYYKGVHVGTRNPSAFSFNVVKQIASGEGGIITVDDKDIAEKMKRLRWCGIDESTWRKEGKKYKWDYTINEVGYKYHFNDILGSIARVQLSRLDFTNGLRRKYSEMYNDLLADLPVVRPYAEPQIIHSWHQYIIRVDSHDRDNLIDFLAQHDIAAGMHYKPINLYPIFDHGETPVTDIEWRRMITLPLHARLSEDDVRYVCEVIHQYYEQKRS